MVELKPKPRTETRVIEMLEKTPLWSGLSRQELKEIAKKSEERRYGTGDIIVRKGDRAPAFYLILEGTVNVKSEGRTLSTLGPGQFFGEMSILDNQLRTADVCVSQLNQQDASFYIGRRSRA
jgi:CRP-like cAMP-binding protein